MSETKFSPGPWTFSPDDEYCAYNIVGPVTGSHGTSYQETIAGVQQPYDSDESRTEALANARLIAAAPEMYELIRAALDGDDFRERAVTLLDRIVGRGSSIG